MCMFAVVQEHGGKLASVKMDNVQSNVVFIYMNHPELMNSEQFVQRMMQVKTLIYVNGIMLCMRIKQTS